MNQYDSIPPHQSYDNFIKKIHVSFTYRNTTTGKTRKTFAMFAHPPETPDFVYDLVGQ